MKIIVLLLALFTGSAFAGATTVPILAAQLNSQNAVERGVGLGYMIGDSRRI
tara:strand:- start:972 stop:1127 length:156 start_codon:yes stop_codon:yes gene_type:complete